MNLYSYKGEYPKPLPTRIFLESGYSVTSLQDCDESELRSFGFIGPIEEPQYDINTERLFWDGENFSVLPIEKKYCDFCNFSICFQKSSINQKLQELSAINSSLSISYIKFINYLVKTDNKNYSISDLKNFFDEIFSNYEVTIEDLNELESLLLCDNLPVEKLLESIEYYQNLFKLKSEISN